MQMPADSANVTNEAIPCKIPNESIQIFPWNEPEIFKNIDLFLFFFFFCTRSLMNGPNGQVGKHVQLKLSLILTLLLPKGLSERL